MNDPKVVVNLRGFKGTRSLRPLGAIKTIFDSRRGGSTNQKHVESIVTMLDDNLGHLKDIPIITNDNGAVTSRHGVEALTQYYAALGVNLDTVQIPVVVLNADWEGRSQDEELRLRLIAFDENARLDIKLANEQADVTMMIGYMVRKGMSDRQILSDLSTGTPLPLLRKAIKTARQSESQTKRETYVSLRDQGVSAKEAREKSKINPITAARVEKHLQQPEPQTERVRLHKLTKAIDAVVGQWGRATDKAVTEKLTQQQRRKTYQHMDTLIARLQRKQKMAKATIEDYINSTAQHIC